MIWLKSIGMGLVALLILVILYVVSNVILQHARPTSFYSFSWQLACLIVIVVFLLGFGLELRHLKH